jgi:putative oxidoreductase
MAFTKCSPSPDKRLRRNSGGHGITRWTRRSDLQTAARHAPLRQHALPKEYGARGIPLLKTLKQGASGQESSLRATESSRKRDADWPTQIPGLVCKLVFPQLASLVHPVATRQVMKPLIIKILKVYDAAIRHLDWPQSLLLLFVRLVWGWGFFQTGWGKLGNLERVTGFFTELGIPASGFQAVVVAFLETTGGLMLIVGLLSRLVSIPLIVTMIVAYITTEKEAIATLFTENYEDFFGATPWLYLFACLLVLLFGPGRLSIDALWRRRSIYRRETE